MSVAGAARLVLDLVGLVAHLFYLLVKKSLFISTQVQSANLPKSLLLSHFQPPRGSHGFVPPPEYSLPSFSKNKSPKDVRNVPDTFSPDASEKMDVVVA